MSSRVLVCLLNASLFSMAAHAAPLFTEDFNAEITARGRHRQAQTDLPIKHGYDVMPGWTRLGDGMPAHFVEHAPGDWALMVVAREPNQNVFTLNEGFAANAPGHTYTVSFDVGPAVYQGLSQVTTAEDELAIELLRIDGTILKRHQVKPGRWEAQRELRNCTFTYEGDGSGPLRFRISPVFTSGTRFYGAIDNLQVFSSKAEAEDAIRERLADAERAREELRRQARLIEQLPPLERDWMFQADDHPTVDRVQQEIIWTCELAGRIGKASREIDLNAELEQLGKLEERLQDEAEKATAVELYLDVRRLKRAITLKNPAIDFSRILLVDNPYPDARHESAHRHGYRASGQGRLLILEGLHPDSPVRSLVPEEKAGFLWRPDLSFDAEKVVLCLMPCGEKSFHLYEVHTDGSGFRQLTFGDYDDLDPIYLPNGKLLFNTTRANTYVRCGPTHHSPVLARGDADGKNIYVISRNNEPDYLPALLPDGRVIFTRWEYTDKEQKRAQSLWTMNPDGTGIQIFWGNQSVWPDILAEPRPIPGTGKIMFTGVGHHLWFEGSIGIIDPAKGMNYPDGLSKVTSEIAWPEVGNGRREKTEADDYRPGKYRAYKTPYPIGKEDFLVSIKRSGQGNFSLYLMDLAGNRELIYSGKHNVWHAMPLKPRRKPRAIPDQIEWPKIGPNQERLAQGVLFSADVFEGAPRLPKQKVKYLRVLQIDAKTYTPWMKTYQHSGPSISVTQADGVKRILGTTPVEADGSVAFKVPPGVSLHFQLLDGDYRCIQTMRSFTGVMPGETRGCVGCHEGRRSTPVYADGGLAMRRGPQELTPPPWGAEVSIGYERFVQPVLNKYCGKCHQGDGEARAKLDLTLRNSRLQDPVYPSLPPQFKEPYVTLVGGGNNWYQPVDGKLVNAHGLPASISGCLIVEGYRERTPEALATLAPMTCMSSASLLIDRAVDEQHIKAKMDPKSLRRLIGWVDANGPYLGEEEIRQMPDPTPETRWATPVPVVKPRLKTAPRINRFNIRQDGDSSRVFLGAMEESP
jgi:hydrazine synthase alpha subunit-like protein